MTPDDFIIGSVVTGLYVALCLCGDSFVHLSEATESMDTFCLISEGFGLVQVPVGLSFRCGIFL
jgi:hypothetical protein